VLDPESLGMAFEGAHTTYIMKTPDFGPDAVEFEFNRGKAIVDLAVQKGLEYIIFSTLPSVSEFSGRKYTKVTAFDAKARIEYYTRSLPVKSAFYAPGFFMENIADQPFLNPQKTDDETWIMARSSSPTTPTPYIYSGGDAGKFVGAILANPEKYEGKTFCAAQAFYTMQEVAAILSKTQERRSFTSKSHARSSKR